ncbi:MAG: succinate dehydrogenase, cytochrome b556 subunit [Gammaproteobacteria bacterium]|nr:succinate dehydrogenase, cytochrome b556 subunit [Gammaproteobacteria bacterium]
MKDKRPVNLKITSIHFPIAAIISILHRLSGLALFVLLPVCLAVFCSMMRSQQSFDWWLATFHRPIYTVLLWLLLLPLLYHFVAGIRHLLMDVGCGESLCGGRLSAKLVLTISILLAIILGGLLWLGMR